MRAGTTYILIDNVTEILESGELSAVLTTNYWKDRVLGVSEAASWPVRATWVATGNNLAVGGDLIRRVYRCRLDAEMSQPWRRSGFKHPELRGT